MIRDIYTDGACSNNGKPNAKGGWAYIVCEHDSDKIVYFKKRRTKIDPCDSNRAELEAIYEAIKYCVENKELSFVIYTDSETIEIGINGRGKIKANIDIWSKIEELCTTHMPNIIAVKKVKAHAGDNSIKTKMNEMVDGLAKQAAKSLLSYMQIDNDLEELIYE